ncbi:MAG TPA: Nramp family divalent metal transporter [Pirellulaceae bacterium]|nr:Nramp family divalent metal transporter [Pirellulaceae bacterium]
MTANDPSSPARSTVSLVETPPTSVLGILSRLGPGLIIAGSIVGSGELIATTSTGGKAGYVLLWLILIGCVIKVFVQVEFGRFSIVTGKTTMEGLNEVPGPRVAVFGNWLIWYWFFMFLSSLGQLGGIVGGVGQAMAISVPLSEKGRAYNEYREVVTQLEVTQAELRLRESQPDVSADLVAKIRARHEKLAQQRATYTEEIPPAGDDRTWAIILTVGTSLLLILGRYRFIEAATTIMVAGFTFVTVVNVGLLQLDPVWGMTWNDLKAGLSFQLPQGGNSASGYSAVATALATFGIIGVGTNELLAYPYFCIEKGYARFTGPRDTTDSWANRARGWMRVMRADAWCSMIIYTFATVAFYLLGAAILHPIGLDPKGTEMIRTLAVMYEPIFGSWAPALFLVGAFAVLYSTFFVANAGHARVCADVVRVLSHGKVKERGFHLGVRIFSGVLPFVCLFMYLIYGEPRAMILFSGFMQNLMLPMLAGAALYFRYYRNDPRIKPSPVWDFFLWLSAVGLLLVAAWAVVERGPEFADWVREIFSRSA